MKKIMLCGRPAGCCPHVEEDRKKGVMYIVDGDQKIAFDKMQTQKLTEYLNARLL